MANKVVVTGVPGGQIHIHYGVKIRPGVLVTVSERDAEAYGKDVQIVKRIIEDLQVPKPGRKETTEQIMAEGKKTSETKEDSAVETAKRAIAIAESGRMDRGGQQRGK